MQYETVVGKVHIGHILSARLRRHARGRPSASLPVPEEGIVSVVEPLDALVVEKRPVDL